MLEKAAYCVTGVALGLMIYRFALGMMFGNAHFTMCDVCRYKNDRRKKNRGSH